MLKNDKMMIQENNSISIDEKKIHLKHHENTKKSFEIIINPNHHAEMLKKGEWKLSHKGTKAALLILLFRDEPILHNPYKFLMKLVNVDELFTTWRYRHLMLASKMIFHP